MSNDRTAPTSLSSDRYDAMDVLRGFALCGILLMNIIGMGTPWVTNFPPFPAAWSDPSWQVWFAEHAVFEGTMRGLFTLLFGAAVLLITGKGDRVGQTISVADVWFRRCLILLGLGLINFTLLLWPGDILWNYGCAGLFLFVFRKAAPWKLAAMALMIMALLSVGEGWSEQESVQDYRDGLAAHQAQVAGQTLTDEQTKALESYTRHERYLSPPPASIEAEAAERMGSYPQAVEWSFEAYADWGLNGWGIFLILESIGFMFMGMALFRWRVITGERSMGFYLAMTVVGYAVGVSINVAEHLAIWNGGFSPEVWWPNYTYEVSRLPTTLGHLGLIMLLWKARALFFVGDGLRAIGKMALTNYLGQSLVAAIIFYGLGWWNHLTWAELWLLCVPVWIGQAIFSVLWLKRFEYGPLEWALRAIAYGRRPPMTKSPAA
ncbi:DUF418 domain-containing protein [Brevundimonas aveniformis]|uniref:DUF418 domain-containing protein n=1 Tax=Brevundimonas aveniformis TaxID=370977 RepID=UPI0003FE8C5C|nr:DUF418 domain-containing protein [Brevundimonas aveniformis]